MADDLTVTQQIAESLSELVGSITQSVKGITADLNIVPGKLTESAAGFTQVAEGAKRADQSVNTLSGSLVKFTNQLSGAFEQVKKLTETSQGEVGGLSKALIDVGAVGAASILPISSAFSSLGSSAGTTGDIIDKKYSSLISTLSKASANMIMHAEANKKAEIGLLSLHAKAGDLNTELNRTSTDIEHLSNLTNEFANTMEQVSIATGTTTGETSEYAKQLLKIPGAYSKIISDTPVGSISLLQAAMTVASGTTQDFSDVFSVMDQQFKNFGQTGKQPLELMSQMYSASQTLGLPFQYISAQIKDTSDRFKLFGDNTGGALKILNGFAPALKASGVGPEGIKEIIGNLTGAVGSLDIAQKSFISSQTGGAGGLQGGYQIDLLMQQGKMDEVFSKMEESLKKQFGKIVSLEDAAKSPEAAGQLTKQVAFLRQGPMGDIAKSDAGAYKILDAFKMGAKPEIEKPTEKNEAFTRVMDQGGQIQERHNNLLTIASAHLDRFGSSIGDINHKILRDLVGTGGDQRGGAMNEVILSKMNDAKINSSQDQPDTTGGEAAFLQSFGKGASLIGSAIGVVGDKIKTDTGSILSNVEKSVNEKPKNENIIKENMGPTTVAPYIRPIEVPEPQLTPVNNLQKMINQSDPNSEAKMYRENLLNLEKSKTSNVGYKETSQPKNDTLTIMLKSDSMKESQVVAIVNGRIEQIERKDRDMAGSGIFTGNNN